MKDKKMSSSRPSQKKNIISVSIGISAYNEEANIAVLLRALLDQIESGFKLKDIIVLSDGSTDGTVACAGSVHDRRISVIDSKKRLGQALRQNELFNKANCDFYVLLDADVLPQNSQVLERMVEAYKKYPDADIVGAKILPLPSDSFIGKLIDWHKNWKYELYEQINKQDNVFLCHGSARGFSRRAYQQIRWPKVWSEDAYSYLVAKQLGFGFRYCHAAVFNCRSPQALNDHVKQSVRFLTFSRQLQPYFQVAAVRQSYLIPKNLFLLTTFKGFLKQPLYSLVYAGLFTYCLLLVKTGRVQHDLSIWDIATSTKQLVINDL